MKLPAGVAAPAPAPLTLDARVQLLHWIEIDGAAAIELTASWNLHEPLDVDADQPAGTPPSEADSRFEGHYVVLASGRLLHAAVRGVADITLQTGGPSPSRQHIEHRHELRLVAACDGPVLPSPLAERSPEERALAAHSALGTRAAGRRSHAGGRVAEPDADRGPWRADARRPAAVPCATLRSHVTRRARAHVSAVDRARRRSGHLHELRQP